MLVIIVIYSMKNSKNSGVMFMAVGAAFMALGLNNQTTFLAVGIAFLGLGASLMARSKQCSDDRQL